MTLIRLDHEPIFTALATRVGVLEGGSYPGDINVAGSVNAGANLSAPTVRGFSLGTGWSQLVNGDISHSGNVEFKGADGTRYSYIGNQTSSGALSLVSANGFAFTGGATTFGGNLSVTTAGNGYTIITPGNATVSGQIQFRTADAVQRATIGSVSAAGSLALTSDNGAGFIFNITGQPNFCQIQPTYTTFGQSVVFNNDFNFTANIVSSNPRLTFDANDYFYYNRSVNAHVLVVNNADAFTVTASACTVTGALNVGNDVNFGLNRNGGSQPILVFDSGDNFSYVRASNNYIWNIGNVAIMGLTSSALNIVPGVQLVINDSAFNLQISGGTPLIVFDTNDYIQFDRTANKYNFFVGGTKVASLDGSGNMKLLGTLTQSTTP